MHTPYANLVDDLGNGHLHNAVNGHVHVLVLDHGDILVFMHGHLPHVLDVVGDVLVAHLLHMLHDVHKALLGDGRMHGLHTWVLGGVARVLGGVARVLGGVTNGKGCHCV